MSRSSLAPGDVDALLFDVVGTLVDDHTTFATTADRLAEEAGTGAGPDLCAAWLRALDRQVSAVVDGEAAWQPYGRLVSVSAQEAVTGLGGRWTDLAATLVDSLDATYEAWPEVSRATSVLRQDRIVACLSNADLDSLARLAHRQSLDWDVVLSAGSVATFKPDPAAYRYAVDVLRLDPARTLFVAAHPWDLRAAAQHGFRTAYVARPDADRPAVDDRFDVEVDDLDGLVALLQTSQEA